MRLWLGLILLVGGVAAGAAQSATTPAMREAMTDHAYCLKAAARKVDDGISDPASVGAAIVPLCAAYLQRVIETTAEGNSPDFRLRFVRNLEAAELKLATSAVMAVRSGRRQR